MRNEQKVQFTVVLLEKVSEGAKYGKVLPVCLFAPFASECSFPGLVTECPELCHNVLENQSSFQFIHQWWAWEKLRRMVVMIVK